MKSNNISAYDAEKVINNIIQTETNVCTKEVGKAVITMLYTTSFLPEDLVKAFLNYIKTGTLYLGNCRKARSCK